MRITVRSMRGDRRTVGDGVAGQRRGPARFRRRSGLAVLSVWMVVVTTSACSGDATPQATPSTNKSTSTTGFVAATTPEFPPGVRACDTVSTLAGWPTTAPARPDADACILDALAAGTPAQMSTISAAGDSGRKTPDGSDIPTRRIVTLRVLGMNEVRVMTDLTEDGGTVTTRTCAGLVADSLGFHGINCS